MTGNISQIINNDLFSSQKYSGRCIWELHIMLNETLLNVRWMWGECGIVFKKIHWHPRTVEYEVCCTEDVTEQISSLFAFSSVEWLAFLIKTSRMFQDAFENPVDDVEEWSNLYSQGVICVLDSTICNGHNALFPLNLKLFSFTQQNQINPSPKLLRCATKSSKHCSSFEENCKSRAGDP